MGLDFWLNIDFHFFNSFCLLFWSRSQFGSCGRLIGRISTKSGPNLIGFVRDMIEKLRKTIIFCFLFFVLFLLVWVVLVVDLLLLEVVSLAQVPAVALPLLLPVLKPPPGPPKPPEPLRINRLTQNAVENSFYRVLC